MGYNFSSKIVLQLKVISFFKIFFSFSRFLGAENQAYSWWGQFLTANVAAEIVKNTLFKKTLVTTLFFLF
jgi:hypothetical protein